MLCGFAQCSTLTLHEAPYQSLLEGPSLSMQHMALHPTKPNISLLFQGLSWGSVIYNSLLALPSNQHNTTFLEF